MSLLFLLIMGVALILPVRLANSEVLDANIRIDRTDFPALYLSKPELQGEAVWMLQARLRELGYYIEPNGVYNQATSDMIKIFQVANNLTVNGQVSRVEWETIMDMEESEPCLTQPEGESRIRIVIDIVKHSLTVFSDDQPIKKYAIGVGKSSTPSPLGDWKIVQKSYDWGNGFGTRWMGLNVPWGIYGIHGTNKPGSVGYSQSHGCIRMRNKDVEELFPQIPMGTWVRIVENGNIFPRAFNGKPLQIKSSGQNVVYLQNQLKQNGIIFDNADGRFGAMTELAVKYYQIWHGLKPTGKADTETYRSLGMIK
jgi:lipoprotein-anchoring transpeptidase ErfK/SrfK